MQAITDKLYCIVRQEKDDDDEWTDWEIDFQMPSDWIDTDKIDNVSLEQVFAMIFIDSEDAVKAREYLLSLYPHLKFRVVSCTLALGDELSVKEKK